MAIDPRGHEQQGDLSGLGSKPAAEDEALRALFKSLETALPRPAASLASAESDGARSARVLRHEPAHPMPRFLNGGAEEGPAARAGLPAAARLSVGASLVALGLLGAWVLAMSPSFLDPAPKQEKTAASLPEPTTSRLNFVGSDGCREEPCRALVTFVPESGAVPALAAGAQAPTAGAQTAGAGAAEASPALDPLDTVSVKGLPPESRLTVGNKVSDREWALTVGDLRNLGLVVPSGHTEPIRAEFEIKKRDGREVAAFGLTIEREPAYTTAGDASRVDQIGAASPSSSGAAPAKRPEANAASSATTPARAAAGAGAARPRAKTAKAQKAAGTPTQKSVAVVQSPVPKPPAAPVAPVKSGTSAKQAAETETPGAPWPFGSAGAPGDTPAEREEGPKPGFETLINLGGGFFAFDPAQP
jgi:hypothetical protein